MSCEYCKNNESLIHGFKKDKYQYWVDIEVDELVFDGIFEDGAYHERESINYCPMCGSKLGDSDD